MDKLYEGKRWAGKLDYYKAARKDVIIAWQGSAKTNPLCSLIDEYVCGLFPPKERGHNAIQGQGIEEGSFEEVNGKEETGVNIRG